VRAGRAASPNLARLASASVVLILGCGSAPAAAQAGAVLSLFSDARFRGVSVSGERPVAILDLSYDAPNGLYLATSATLVASGRIEPLSVQFNGGYARRVGAVTTIDLGAVHSSYSRYSTAVAGGSYTELYAGLTHKSLTARVHLSPHYFHSGTWTLYGEVDHSLGLARNLSLDSHVGLLVPLRSRDNLNLHPQVDWRAGLNRQVGRVALHLAATGARGIRRYAGDHYRRHAAIVIGASFAL
jgi:uncharacterized protein (TIGR02001 family)